MGLAKKLREVVAANFIEIARVEPPPAKPEPPPTLPDASLRHVASAEAELDSFLKTVKATPTPEGAAPPEPVAPAEPVQATPPLVSLVDAVSDEGDVDFDRVYQQYELPVASFSAEQAMNMLQALPRDLALRTKRATVNTTLSAIGKVVGTSPKDIVLDAARKKEGLERFLEALSHEIEETTAATEAEIERLQAEITLSREKLRVVSRRRTAAGEVCHSRMHLLNQVIYFFDYDEGTLNGSEPPPLEAEATHDTDEMPAYMREDAVRRMLGITEEETGTFDPVAFTQKYGTGDESDEPGGESENDGAAARRPRVRR